MTYGKKIKLQFKKITKQKKKYGMDFQILKMQIPIYNQL